MKESTVFLVGLAVALTVARADEFYLTDSLGTNHGPFEFRQGNKISVAGQELVISRVLSEEQRTVEKMKSIIIPEVDFRQSNFLDVVEFLQQASATYAPNNESQFGLRTPPWQFPEENGSGQEPATSSGTNQAPVQNEDSTTNQAPLITIKASYVSVYDVLNAACDMCNLKWSVNGSVIVIEPEGQ